MIFMTGNQIAYLFGMPCGHDGGVAQGEGMGGQFAAEAGRAAGNKPHRFMLLCHVASPKNSYKDMLRPKWRGRMMPANINSQPDLQSNIVAHVAVGCNLRLFARYYIMFL